MRACVRACARPRSQITNYTPFPICIICIYFLLLDWIGKQCRSEGTFGRKATETKGKEIKHGFQWNQRAQGKTTIWITNINRTTTFFFFFLSYSFPAFLFLLVLIRRTCSYLFICVRITSYLIRRIRYHYPHFRPPLVQRRLAAFQRYSLTFPVAQSRLVYSNRKPIHWVHSHGKWAIHWRDHILACKQIVTITIIIHR